jgi:hypothetical protein
MSLILQGLMESLKEALILVLQKYLVPVVTMFLEEFFKAILKGRPETV